MMTSDAAAPALTPPVGPNDRAQGATDAPTLVISGDDECPYTRRAHEAVGRFGPTWAIARAWCSATSR